MPESPRPHPLWLRVGSNFVTIEVVARPGSQRRGLLRIEPRGLVIGVASPAEKGRANEELIAEIAHMTGVPHSEVSILRGAATRTKVVRVGTAQPAEIERRLLALAKGETKVKRSELR